MNRLLLARRSTREGGFGDNLKWLADTKVYPDASVDLEYLDPPFNSNANYNVLFKEAEQLGKLRDERTKCEPQAVASGSERSQPSGEASQAQFHAFTDTWECTAGVQSRNDTLRNN